MPHPIKKMFLAIALGAILICSAAPPLAADEVAQGRAYFARYCASCHGADADGRGPAASALKEQPPDLRRLSERYGMPLPAARIARFIDGRDEVAAHGSREMPVWGRRFEEAWTAHRTGQPDMKGQIDEIVKYLDSIQLAGHPAQVPAAAPSTPPP